MRLTRILFPVLTLALAACTEGKSEVKDTRPPRPVLARQVRYEPAVHERIFVATVRPRVESDLGFRVAELALGQGLATDAHLERAPVPPAHVAYGVDPKQQQVQAERSCDTELR